MATVLLLTNLRAQFTFNNYYQSGSLSLAVHTQTLIGNEFLVSGYFKDSLTGQQGIEFRKISQNGNTLLRKRYFNGIEDIGTFFHNGIVLENAGPKFYFTSGTITGTNNSVYVAAINKSSLDTLWTKVYFNSVYNYYMNSIFRVKPNEIWLVGTRGNATSILTPIAMKCDTLGNLLAVKEFTNYTNYDCLAIDYDAVNARLYFAGNNFNVNPSGYNVACLDTTGTIVWNKNITTDNYYFRTIKAIGGELICAGNKKVSNILTNGENKMTFCKYNLLTGNLILSKSFGVSFYQNSFSCFQKLIDNSIVFGGYYAMPPLSTGYRHDGILFKVNSNGDSLWMRRFDNFSGNIGELFFDIKQTPDNGFIACGAPIYAPTPQSQSWVVKTDSLGMAPGAITVNLNEQELPQFSTTIYPNPFKTSIQVEANNALNVTLRISDVFGKLQHTQNLSEANTTVNLAFLPHGIYFVSFSNERGQSKTIKLVKE